MSKHLLIRIPALLIFAIGIVAATAPAHAQAYDPDYPVCLQTYGPFIGYIDCSYTSLAACAASASGRPAQCLVNPYFANDYQEAPRLRHRRHRRN